MLSAVCLALGQILFDSHNHKITNMPFTHHIHTDTATLANSKIANVEIYLLHV